MDAAKWDARYSSGRVWSLEPNTFVADLIDWDLGAGCWELVAHVYLHWPTSLREPFLRRCADAVAPGGYLIIVGHDRDNIEHGHGGPQDPDVLTTPGELTDLLSSCGLEVIEAKTVLRPVHLEGGHGAADVEAADAIDHVVVARRSP